MAKYTSKDDRKTKAVIKDMSVKGKIDHIWTYYKLHFLAAAIAIAVAAWALNAFVLNPPKKSYVALALYSSAYVPEEVREAVEEALGPIVPEELTETLKPFVYTFYLNEQDPQYYSAMQQQFYALIMSAELDVLLCAREDLAVFETGHVPMDMRDFFSQSELTALSDKLIYSEEEPTVPIAVDISGSAFLADLAGAAPQVMPAASIAVNTKHPEAAKEVMLLILGN